MFEFLNCFKKKEKERERQAIIRKSSEEIINILRNLNNNAKDKVKKDGVNEQGN